MRTLHLAELLSALLAVGTTSAAAQGQLEWSATHGPSPGTTFHAAACAAVYAQGNVHAALCSQAAGGYDTLVVKHAPSGALSWTRRFDTGAAANDVPRGIALAPNGDVCVVGHRQLGQYDAYCV